MKIKSLFFLSFIFILFSCSKKPTKTYFCNSEKKNDALQVLLDNENSSINFNGYDMLTDEFAFSNSYSLKLSKQKPYAFTINIPNVKPEQKYEVMVMVKDPQKSLRLVAQGSNKFYKKTNEVSSDEDKGWQKLILNFTTPKDFSDKSKLKVYLWNKKGEDAFADDFTVNIY